MTNQNKAKTRDELRDELAEAYDHMAEKPMTITERNRIAFIAGFDAATEYHNANPSPGQQAVQGLLDALERIKTLTYSWVIAEKTKDCSHTYNEIKYQVDNALETYRKVTSKE